MRSSFGRKVVAGLLGAAATSAMLVSTGTPAHAAPFTMSLVGGTLSLGTQGTTALTGGIACQNGIDDELPVPFGTPDGLIDHPADPQCASPYDADETAAGFQAPDPVEFTGTIDGGLNFTVSSSFVPVNVALTTSSAVFPGACDDDVFVAKANTTLSDLAPHTGNLGAGTMTINLRMDLVLDIQCDTDLGPGQSFVPFDPDGAGGQDPWGGATPVTCSHNMSSTNLSASGDTGPASISKVQDPSVASPMAGKNLGPALLFGDVFDAIPIVTGDTRCGFFEAFVFGTANADNSALQLGMIPDTINYASSGAGVDINVGDVTLPEGDGGNGALGCAGRDCKNKAQVVVTLDEPCPIAECLITVIADSTTGGSALAGTKINFGGADYQAITAAKPKVLKIKLGKNTAKLSINVTPDQTDEPGETIFVDVIAHSPQLVENDGVGMITIVDDDDLAEPDTGIAIGDAIVYESADDLACLGALKCKGTAVLPIVASSPVLSAATLSYTITDGEDVVAVFSAAEAIDGKTIGDDFKPVLIAKFKTLNAGKNTSLLVITIYGDNSDEDGVFSGETFTVTMTGAGVTDGIGTVRINNDD